MLKTLFPFGNDSDGTVSCERLNINSQDGRYLKRPQPSPTARSNATEQPVKLHHREMVWFLSKTIAFSNSVPRRIVWQRKRFFQRIKSGLAPVSQEKAKWTWTSDWERQAKSAFY